MPAILGPLFGKAKVKLGQTFRAVTPIGGWARFIAFLRHRISARQVQIHLPG